MASLARPLRLASRIRGLCGAPRGAAATPYERLGVPKTATSAQIKMAFFKKARKVHPDVNDGPDAASEFRALNEAFRLLSDDERRRAYDAEGTSMSGAAADDPRWR